MGEQEKKQKSFHYFDQSDWLLSITHPAQCPANEERSSSSGVILSPGFPSNYPNSQTCSWLIHMVPGTVCVEGVQPVYAGLCVREKNNYVCAHLYLQVCVCVCVFYCIVCLHVPSIVSIVYLSADILYVKYIYVCASAL